MKGYWSVWAPVEIRILDGHWEQRGRIPEARRHNPKYSRGLNHYQYYFLVVLCYTLLYYKKLYTIFSTKKTQNPILIIQAPTLELSNLRHPEAGGVRELPREKSGRGSTCG